MRKRKLGTADRRTAVLFVTVRVGERKQVEREAQSVGLTMSSAARLMILRDLKRTGSKSRTRRVS
jgi:hypothetical protein